MSPRYDVPKAAPEPLRQVQRFLNSIDLEHEDDWLPAWLDERGLGADLERARGLREALRALAIANNGTAAPPAAVGRRERGGRPACATRRRRGPRRDQWARQRGRRGARVRARGDARRQLGAAEGVPQLPLVVLRLFAEPVGRVVLDAAVREPCEDAGLPPTPRRVVARVQTPSNRVSSAFWTCRRFSASSQIAERSP